MNLGLPARAAAIAWYTRLSSQRFTHCGSRLGRSPRMGNGVSGRLSGYFLVAGSAGGFLSASAMARSPRTLRVTLKVRNGSGSCDAAKQVACLSGVVANCLGQLIQCSVLLLVAQPLYELHSHHPAIDGRCEVEQVHLEQPAPRPFDRRA